MAHFKLYYIETKTQTLESIQKLDFNRSIPNRFSLGYRNPQHQHWFAIDIESNNQERLYLYFTNLFAKDFTFYYQDSNGKWQSKEAGYNESNRSQSIWTSKPTLAFSANYNARIYVKIESDVAIVGEFLLFEDLSELIDYQSHYYLLFALFFGVLLMSMVINLFLFITLKDRVYGYYVGYLLFFGSFVFMVNSLHSPFATPTIIHLFRMCSPIALIFFILFFKELLGLKTIALWLDRVFTLILIAVVFFLIMIQYSTSPWYGLLAQSSSILYTLLILSTLLAIYYKINKARVYLIIILIQLFSSWLMASMYSGVLENNDINQYSFMVVTMFNFMFFTIILANRINEETQQKLKIEQEFHKQQETYTNQLEHDVQERIQKINALLNEKEVLLREVYHRVKNNFHMVTSLLWIEHENQITSNQKSTLLELINRVKSMALIHQYLLGSDDYSQIKAHEYIARIIQEIEKSYAQKALDIAKDIESFELTPDQALYLGIIINELLTNSVKHYTKQDRCRIMVECQVQQEKVHLDIYDNGEGFVYERAKHRSFGLQLIEEFSQKLNPIESGFTFDKGMHYRLVFSQ
jgi:two-component sensor histidine kinase